MTNFKIPCHFSLINQALTETTLLSGKNLSSSILCVYLDSASDLPETDVQSDPFVIFSVGNCERTSSAKKETDAPVWEQGFTFFVPNPEHDTLKVRVVGKKSHKKDVIEMGHFMYPISELLTQNDMQIILRSFPLRNSNPTSKVTMSLALKFLKKPNNLPNDMHVQSDSPIETAIEAIAVIEDAIVQTQTQTQLESLQVPDHELSKSDTSTQDDTESNDHELQELPEKTHFSVASFGLARIQVSLFYSTKCEHLSVTIHRIM